jgi:hypothetical protein
MRESGNPERKRVTSHGIPAFAGMTRNPPNPRSLGSPARLSYVFGLIVGVFRIDAAILVTSLMLLRLVVLVAHGIRDVQ